MVKKRFKEILFGYIMDIVNYSKCLYDEIKKVDEGVYFNNEEIENLILNYHPDKKVKSIKCLVRKKKPPYYTLCLHVKNEYNQLVSVGLKDCIEYKYKIYDPKKKKRIQICDAFRTIINSGSKTEYYFDYTSKNEFNDRIGVCNNCKCRGKVAVDHFPIPFKKILNDFINKENILFDDVKIEYLNNCGFNLVDTSLKNEFLYYHDLNASYRTLCKKCNSSFGSYSY